MSNDPSFFKLKRIHFLANGQVVWDLAGNAQEWNSDKCIQGLGEGNWSNVTWTGWNNESLSDYERLVAGPNPFYATAQNVGVYRGCATSENGFIRGGHWSNGPYTGLFALDLNFSSLNSSHGLGFRCAR